MRPVLDARQVRGVDEAVAAGGQLHVVVEVAQVGVVVVGVVGRREVGL